LILIEITSNLKSGTEFEVRKVELVDKQNVKALNRRKLKWLLSDGIQEDRFSTWLMNSTGCGMKISRVVGLREKECGSLEWM
jgi:hypothetical protein